MQIVLSIMSKGGHRWVVFSIFTSGLIATAFNALFAAANVCLPPHQDQSLESIDEAFQKAAAPLLASDTASKLFELHQLLSTPPKADAEEIQKHMAAVDQKGKELLRITQLPEESLYAVMSVLALYEKWGSEKWKGKSFSQIPDYKTSDDPELIKALNLTDPKSLKSLRYALLEEMPKSPEKLTQFSAVIADLVTAEMAFHFIFDEKDFESFVKGSLEGKIPLPTYGDKKELLRLLKDAGIDLAQIQVDPNTGEPQVDQTLILQAQALIDALKEFTKKQNFSNTSIAGFNKSLKEMMDSVGGAEGAVSIKDKLSQQARLQTEMGLMGAFVQANEKVPEANSTQTFGASINRQVMVMGGNLQATERESARFDPISARAHLESLETLRKKDLLRVPQVAVRLTNIPTPPKPPQPPAPRYSNADNLSTADLRAEEEANNAQEEDFYKNEYPKWEREVLQPWLEKNAYKGKYQAEYKKGQNSLVPSYATKEDELKHIYASLVTESASTEGAFVLDEKNEFLLELSLDDLTRLVAIKQSIPSLSFVEDLRKDRPAALKQVRELADKLTDFRYDTERVFRVNDSTEYVKTRTYSSFDSPIVKFKSLEEFEKAKNAMKPLLEETAKLIPGLSPYHFGFCGNDKRSFDLPIDDPKAISFRAYNEKMIELYSSSSEKFDKCSFESLSDFSNALKIFNEGLSKEKNSLASSVKASLDDYVKKIESDLKDQAVKDLVQAQEDLRKAIATKKEANLISALNQKIENLQMQIMSAPILAQELKAKNFNEFNFTQLKTIEFILSRYSWGDSFVLQKQNDSQAEEKQQSQQAMALLLVEWLETFKPDSPAQTGELLLSAQKLAAEEGLYLNLVGDDWKKKVNLTQDGKRPNAVEVLSREAAVQKSKAETGNYQIFASEFSTGDLTNGSFYTPPVKWADDKKKGVLKILEENGFSTENTQISKLMSQAAEIIWKGRKESISHGKKIPDSVEKFDTRDVRKAYDDLQKQYRQLYDELGFPKQVVRKGDLAATSKRINQRAISDPEKTFIGAKMWKLRDNLPRIITSSSLDWDTAMYQVFADPNEGPSSLMRELFFRDSASKERNTKIDLRSEKTKRENPKDRAVMESLIYKAFDFMGIPPNEKMARILQEPEYDQMRKSMVDYAEKFFESGRSLYESFGEGPTYTVTQLRGLHRDDVDKIMKLYATNKAYRQAFHFSLYGTGGVSVIYGVDEPMKEYDASRILAEAGLGDLWSANTRDKKIILNQLKDLRTFVVSGANLFDPSIGDYGSQSKPAMHLAIQVLAPALFDEIFYGESVDQSGLPEGNKMGIIENRLRSLFQMAGIEFSDSELVSLSKRVGEDKDFDIDGFLENAKKLATGELRTENLSRGLPNALSADPLMNKFLQNAKNLSKIQERDEKFDQVFSSITREWRASRVIEALKQATTTQDINPNDMAGLMSAMSGDMALKSHLMSSLMVPGEGDRQAWFKGRSRIDTPYDYIPTTDESEFMSRGLSRLSAFVWSDPKSSYLKGDKKNFKEDLILKELFGRRVGEIGFISPAASKALVDSARKLSSLSFDLENSFKQETSLSRESLKNALDRILRIEKANENFTKEIIEKNPIQKDESPEARQTRLQTIIKADPRIKKLSILENSDELTPESAKKMADEIGLLQFYSKSELHLRQLNLFRQLIAQESTLLALNKNLSDSVSSGRRAVETLPSLIEDLAATVAVTQRYHISTDQIVESLKKSDKIYQKMGTAMMQADLDRMWKSEHPVTAFFTGGGKAVANMAVGAAAGVGSFLYELGEGIAIDVADQLYYSDSWLSQISPAHWMMRGIYGKPEERDFARMAAWLGGWDSETGEQSYSPPMDLFSKDYWQSYVPYLTTTSAWKKANPFSSHSWMNQNSLMSLDPETGFDRPNRYRKIFGLDAFEVSDHQAGKIGAFTFTGASLVLMGLGRPTGLVDSAGNQVIRRGATEQMVRSAGGLISESRAGQIVGRGMNYIYKSWPIRKLDGLWGVESVKIPTPWRSRTPLLTTSLNPRNWFQNSFIWRKAFLRELTPASKSFTEALTKPRYLFGKPMPSAALASRQAVMSATARRAPEAIEQGSLFIPKALNFVKNKAARGTFLTFQSTALTAFTMWPTLMWSPDALGHQGIPEDDSWWSAIKYTMNWEAVRDSGFESVFILWSLGAFHRGAAGAAMKLQTANSPTKLFLQQSLLKANSGLSAGIMLHIGKGIAAATPPYAFLLTDRARLEAHGIVPSLLSQHELDEMKEKRTLSTEDRQIIANFWSSAALGYLIVANNFWGGDPSKDSQGLRGVGQKVWRAAAKGQTTREALELHSLQNSTTAEMLKYLEADISRAALFMKDPTQLSQIRDRILNEGNKDNIFEMFKRQVGHKPTAEERESIRQLIDGVFERGLTTAENQRLQMEGLTQKGNPTEKLRDFFKNLEAQGPAPDPKTNKKGFDVYNNLVNAEVARLGIPPELLFATAQSDMLTDVTRRRLKRLEEGKWTDQSLFDVPDALEKFKNQEEYDSFLRAVMMNPILNVDPKAIKALEGRRGKSGKSEHYISPKMLLSDKRGPEGQLQYQVVSPSKENLLGWERRSAKSETDAISLLHQNLDMVFEFEPAGKNPVRRRWYGNGMEFIGKGGRSLSIFRYKEGLRIVYRAEGSAPVKEFTSVEDAGPIFAEMGIWVGKDAGRNPDSAWTVLSEVKTAIELAKDQPQFTYEDEVQVRIGKNMSLTNPRRHTLWNERISETYNGIDGSVRLTLLVPNPRGGDREISIPLPAQTSGRVYSVKPKENAVYLQDMFKIVTTKILVDQGIVQQMDPQGKILNEMSIDQFLSIANYTAQQHILPSELELAHIVSENGVTSLYETIYDSTNYTVTGVDILSDLQILGLTDKPIQDIELADIAKVFAKLMDENNPTKNPSPMAHQRQKEIIDAYKRLEKFFGKVKLDYYALLGVERYASTEAIRTRYREIVKKFHPDSEYYRSLDEDKQAGLDVQFRMMTDIKDVLLDPEQRQIYDGLLRIYDGLKTDKKASETAQSNASTASTSP